MEKKEQELPDFVVRQTGAAYGVGAFIIASAVVLLVLEIRYHMKEIPVWIYCIIAGIFLLGVWVWMEACNRRLAVRGRIFSYRSAIGRNSSFTLEEIGHGKAAYHASKGRDYLCLYSKEGKTLCRLECSMQNASRLVWYLHDSRIPMELEQGAEGFAGDILNQRPVAEEEMKKLSGQVYGRMQTLTGKWQERNENLGAGFVYGFACYFRGKMKETAWIEPEESRFFQTGGIPGGTEGNKTGKKEKELLPEDYLCRLELYVEKEGHTVQDRRGRLVRLEVPVLYRRKSDAGDKVSRLYYNGGWEREMEEGLYWLGNYLPGHKFVLVQEPLEYRLEKSL